MRYVVLLRGINVGGRNKVPMAGLRVLLADLGFEDVRTYIQSGQALVTSELTAGEVAGAIEEGLAGAFALDVPVRVLVLGPDEYAEVVAQAPAGFGTEPEVYRYDVAFLIGVTADEVLPHMPAHPEIDVVVAGERAVYYRRLIARATQSRIGKVAGSPVYGSLTIRNWRTTTILADMLAGS